MSIRRVKAVRPGRLLILALVLLAGLAGLAVTHAPAERGARGVAAETNGAPPAPPEVECRRASGSIRIDGRADEPAWKQGQVVENFTAHWLDQPSRTATRARLLWDDEALYFFAEMEDSDLYADVTQQDGNCWFNDVFELFFKPAEDRRAYYELEVTAANTHLDMALPSRGAGGYDRFAKEPLFHWQTAVVTRGTLGDWHDQDQGWSVEGRIPWGDFEPTGGRPKAGDAWRFALCRYDYSVAFESPDLTSSAPLTRPDFHHYEDYGVLKFVGKK